MKIFISIDMEGIPGTFNWEHEKIDRPAVRACMTEHITTAIKAILSSKQADTITQVVIADSHAAGDNLSYEITRLDPRISLISGDPRPEYMMPGFDDSYAMVFLLGYHAGTGALKGNMDHTYSNSRIQKIWINGQPMNEALINAAYAGYHKVPVAVVSGDLALRSELMPQMPWLEYVTTKEGLSKFAAKSYSVLQVNEELSQKIHSALGKKDLPIFSFATPCELKIELHSTAMADVACLMPDVQRLDGKAISYSHSDFKVLFNALMALVTLASSVGI
ncbi:MAG: M55 family metallopeptidase [Candidatus Cloacimonadaceae bacterium]|jgi:D-amino peptidase|nr:M55 family metallopeptidase [Candidatus Cloacimonadota bacterium]MCB5254610.1 M55 family metallopeptidase [Candidatus Cloacimonadota bacterium]MCK9178744.1 M55 family metallopeptidase [Candidatus Cloacimonadota bacterium]MCK9243153.1 M55 family metallopeptidase [Candidatus Cloacimonadota bacterium]MDY0128473.1 M55 family metallopeptidase [Candidatus Cloacimonadaceae bacterium]